LLSYAEVSSGGRALALPCDFRYIGWACFNLTPGQGRAISTPSMDPALPE